MTDRLAPAVTALLLACATGARAQAVPRPACLDTATTQAALTACAGEHHKATERRMHQALASARATLEADRQALLDASQRTWEAYAKAQCELEASAVAGGSMYPMTMLSCLAGLTEQRTRAIEALMSPGGGP